MGPQGFISDLPFFHPLVLLLFHCDVYGNVSLGCRNVRGKDRFRPPTTMVSTYIMMPLMKVMVLLTIIACVCCCCTRSYSFVLVPFERVQGVNGMLV